MWLEWYKSQITVDGSSRTPAGNEDDPDSDGEGGRRKCAKFSEDFEDQFEAFQNTPPIVGLVDVIQYWVMKR